MAEKIKTDKKVRVKLVKSAISANVAHQATVRGLGLKTHAPDARAGRHAGCARNDQQGVAVLGEGCLMRLNNLKPNAGSKSARHRVGRGIGSGWGKTAGRGHKGQKSRAGGFHKVGFEGGQMPLYRRLPKRGFTSRSRRYVDVVRLGDLQRLGLAEVDLSVLKQAGIVSAMALDARIVKSGELSTKVSVRGIGVTKGARAAIEAAGGSLVDEPVADSKPTKKAAERAAKIAAKKSALEAVRKAPAKEARPKNPRISHRASRRTRKAARSSEKRTWRPVFRAL